MFKRHGKGDISGWVIEIHVLEPNYAFQIKNCGWKLDRGDTGLKQSKTSKLRMILSSTLQHCFDRIYKYLHEYLSNTLDGF